MTASRLREDEPVSDDQGRGFHSPLVSKPFLKTDDIGSDSTAMTSPGSSRKSSNYYNDSSIAFNDNMQIIEIDCNYSEEEVGDLWFTKDEYDDFLQACDDDAQKHEEHEKEMRVANLKKEIRKQRRQRRREEKLQIKLSPADSLDESMNSMALDNMEDDIIDDSIHEDELNESIREYDEDQEGWLCSLGLEAWTLEGYQEREHHRQKAIDAVLNEQYAAWDRGMVENTEMMSALYFAASATSKHSAVIKARELEEDVQEYALVSTLEDYNKAVHSLNVLQKSLHSIKNKSKPLKSKFDGKRQERRNSAKAASSIIDRALAITEEPQDQAPQLPIKSSSLHTPETSPKPSSSSSSWKKTKPRNASGAPPKIYKSKAATNIIVAPPTPPVVSKRRAIVYKPSKGAQPTLDCVESVNSPSTKSSKAQTNPDVSKVSKSPKAPKSPKASKNTKAPKSHKDPKSPKVSTKSPKSRKIIYKPIVGDLPKVDLKSPDAKKKKKKRDSSKKESQRQPKKHQPTKQQKGDRTRTKSPGPISTKDSEDSLDAGKLSKEMSPTSKSRKVVTKIPRKSAHLVSSHGSTHTSSSHQKSKKEHWWFEQQKQASQ